MRTILAALVLVSAPAAALADTCTAPGHSSCTITCSGGCIAMYTEPNGPCRTACSGSMGAADQQTMSVSNMSLEELTGALTNPTEKLKEMK
jgi:hypothetical protein